ncbi:MAG: glycosyltransferase family 4 protein [Actinomycetota bacterium]
MRVSLITLGDPQTVTGGYLYHLRMAAAAPRHGAVISFVSLPDRPFPLPSLSGPRILRRAVVQRADVTVIDSIAAAFVAPWCRMLPGPPLVAMLHQPPGGIDHGCMRTPVQAFLDRLLYERTARLMVASGWLRDELITSGFAREQVVVVAPGSDAPARAREEVGDLRRGRRAAILSVGNWVARKQTLELLDAFALLPPPLAMLHLAGSDHFEPSYARRVRERLAAPDLRGRVVVHGAVARARVDALYRAADVFVLPSVREPYGTVYAEAMAAGLPVVGWNAGNLPYLATHEREGLVVEPGAVEELAAAMHHLAADAELRAQMSTAARRRARSFPTWDKTAELFFGVLHDVLR